MQEAAPFRSCHPGRYFCYMKPKKVQMEDQGTSKLHEDDPELEREFRMLAQLLIDIYLWRREQPNKPSPQGDIDLTNQPPTL